MDKKITHLDFIQGIITRMGTNSFLLKGWSVTLVTAIFALSTKESEANFILLALLPIFLFWWLDAYYLHQEKLFRKLYDHVASGKISSYFLSLNTSQVKSEVSCLIAVAFSKTLFPFYFTIVIIVVIARIIVR